MPDPVSTDNMDALLARPLNLLGLTNVDQLQSIALHAAGLVDEARFLEAQAVAAELTPVETHAALLARPATYLPELHSLVLERAFKAMPVDEARDLLSEIEQEAVDAVAMRAHCDMFRRNPGLFVPGAKPALSIAFLSRGHELDGWIELADGTTLPWLYAPGGVGRAAVSAAAGYVAGAIGVDRVLVVGTHVHPGIQLPSSLAFVCIAAVDTATRNPGPGAA